MNALIRLLILFLLSLFINIKPAQANDRTTSKQVVIDYTKVSCSSNTFQIKKEKSKEGVKQHPINNKSNLQIFNHKE